MRLLHLSPHPDDELLGAGATLLSLLDSGVEVVNYAVSLGRPADRERRIRELTEACQRAGFQLRMARPALAISGGDDLLRAESDLVSRLVTLLGQEEFDLIISPSPHDRHHGHEVVGRAVVRALEKVPRPPVWWMWGVWGELPLPTLYHPFDSSRLARMQHCLKAHVGELGRNDYEKLLQGRGTAAAVLGPERIFGFGTPGYTTPYAELLSEAVYQDGQWLLGSPRFLNVAFPFMPPTKTDISFWLKAPSITAHLRWSGH